MESFEAETTGNYNGIGIYYGKTTDNKIVIVSPIKDSPAAKAGLLPGDEILKVDDYEVTSESTLTDLSNIIKGEVGKSVKLKIQRGDQILEFDVPRENIKLHQIIQKYWKIKLDIWIYIVLMKVLQTNLKINIMN